jgi:hypothetical protein
MPASLLASSGSPATTWNRAPVGTSSADDPTSISTTLSPAARFPDVPPLSPEKQISRYLHDDATIANDAAQRPATFFPFGRLCPGAEIRIPQAHFAGNPDGSGPLFSRILSIQSLHPSFFLSPEQRHGYAGSEHV